jgi:hypothetical protein
MLFYAIGFWFVLENLGLRGEMQMILDPRMCESGNTAVAVVKNATYFSELALKSSVGFGSLGLHGNMGFEGRCVTVGGQRHYRSLGLHPPYHRSAWVEAKLGKRFHRLQAKVAVNDANNYFGTTGSDLIFIVKGDGQELWRSKGIHKTRVEQYAEVEIGGVSTLRLEVEAQGSNACAHGVWVDPLLLV